MTRKTFRYWTTGRRWVFPAGLFFAFWGAAFTILGGRYLDAAAFAGMAAWVLVAYAWRTRHDQLRERYGRFYGDMEYTQLSLRYLGDPILGGNLVTLMHQAKYGSFSQLATDGEEFGPVTLKITHRPWQHVAGDRPMV